MAGNDIVVYSHLRWGFVYQRPQHLMSRLAARGWRVHFIDACQAILDEPVLRIRERAESMVSTVLLRSWDSSVAAVQILLEEAFLRIDDPREPTRTTMATGTHHPLALRQGL